MCAILIVGAGLSTQGRRDNVAPRRVNIAIRVRFTRRANKYTRQNHKTIFHDRSPHSFSTGKLGRTLVTSKSSARLANDFVTLI